jgi:hypothetical protein
VYHFNVVEELFNATDDVVVGKHIQVIGANDDSRLDMHQMYYLDDYGRSSHQSFVRAIYNTDKP